MRSIFNQRAPIEYYDPVEQICQRRIAQYPYNRWGVTLLMQILHDIARDLILNALVQRGERTIENHIVGSFEQCPCNVELLALHVGQALAARADIKIQPDGENVFIKLQPVENLAQDDAYTLEPSTCVKPTLPKSTLSMSVAAAV
ncbi:hypothetical protein DEV91_10980 [Phyllobacterium brassicacearum]|nr:hypothetical protein DEV91_10980 [Phyllobacterium brassicacearum]